MVRRDGQLKVLQRDKSCRLPVKAFGEDHWSLLAYIDCCCSGHAGRVEHRHMRRKPAVHKTYEPSVVITSKREIGRGLGIDPGLQSRSQDDWDCLADLEAAGFVELVSYATGLVHIFPVGLEAAAAIRAHGARGESIKSFRYT